MRGLFTLPFIISCTSIIAFVPSLALVHHTLLRRLISLAVAFSPRGAEAIAVVVVCSQQRLRDEYEVRNRLRTRSTISFSFSSNGFVHVLPALRHLFIITLANFYREPIPAPCSSTSAARSCPTRVDPFYYLPLLPETADVLKRHSLADAASSGLPVYRGDTGLALSA